MDLPHALFTEQGMSDEEFKIHVLPKLHAKGIKPSYITSPKSWAIATNVMTMFEREYVPGYTYICIKNHVYHLREDAVAGGFRKVGTQQGMFKAKVTPETVTPVTLASVQGTPAPIVEELPDSVYDEPFIPFVGDGEQLQKLLRKPEPIAEPEASVSYPEPLDSDALDLSTPEGFNRFLENRFERTREMMGMKGEEYRKGGDVFHNFNRAAQMNRQIPEESLWGFASKQVISTIDLIEDIKNGKLPSSALVSEKCADLVNYVLLLEAMMLKRIADSAGKNLVH